jgi:hypothetical protein
VALYPFRVCVLLANCGEKAELGYPAKRMGGDVGATRSVAHVLRQFFFPAVWTLEAGLNNDPWHRYRYSNLREILNATATAAP